MPEPESTDTPAKPETAVDTTTDALGEEDPSEPRVAAPTTSKLGEEDPNDHGEDGTPFGAF